MKRFAAILGLLVAVTSVSTVSAQSAAGSAQCGDLVIDEVSHMTKGRTDGMVISVDHRAGCAHLVMRNLVGTGNAEGYGYAGQEANCQRYGKQDAVNTFRYYFRMDVNPSDIKVSCSRYVGDD